MTLQELPQDWVAIVKSTINAFKGYDDSEFVNQPPDHFK